jgi:rhodanese-related sulfurtransferase
LIAEIAPAELDAWRRDASREAPVIIDVREPWEVAICRIDGSRALPLRDLPGAIDDLPRDRDLVIVCHHGARSFHAAAWLAQAGFARVKNLRGGLAAWAQEIDPTMARY